MFVHIYDTNQGGSTITQQLIKNITGDSEQSPSRKIREIFRAMELERAYSKDKILETYMNYIGFGGTSNGIEHAAQKYFGKSAKDLDVAEAACLAAIPKSPETLNPLPDIKMIPPENGSIPAKKRTKSDRNMSSGRCTTTVLSLMTSTSRLCMRS